MGGRGKKKSVLASLFGFKSGGERRRQQQEEMATAAAAGRKQQQLQQQRSYYWPERRRRVWPSDEDNDSYYAERDIDRRASEFIDRVHRGMLIAGGEQDG
ncbi:uncharacterized protein LOC127760129 [Oryza glaberrima]|uniref:Uncharacterized protein n=2 Tax=Oryza TaxID=4527 RepID=A0A0D3EMQ0_9ORYZ|nr:uncharacterized protein LOC127760129 [Oryza glaberrima]